MEEPYALYQGDCLDGHMGAEQVDRLLWCMDGGQSVICVFGSSHVARDAMKAFGHRAAALGVEFEGCAKRRLVRSPSGGCIRFWDERVENGEIATKPILTYTAKAVKPLT